MSIFTDVGSFALTGKIGTFLLYTYTIPRNNPLIGAGDAARSAELKKGICMEHMYFDKSL
jgi:hypothetical protein